MKRSGCLLLGEPQTNTGGREGKSQYEIWRRKSKG